MSTIWIICGSLLIGTAISNCATTTTTSTTTTIIATPTKRILPKDTSDYPPSSSSTKSTLKKRRSLSFFDPFDFSPLSRMFVPSSKSFSPRISMVDSTMNIPNKYPDTSFTNNFPTYHANHPKTQAISSPLPNFDTMSGFKLMSDNMKISTSNPFHVSAISKFNPTLSPMNIRHLVTLGTLEAENSPIYPNKFEDGKFPRLATRPLSPNAGSTMTYTPTNYSPTYPGVKSIKHNPAFTSVSLTNTGNFVPINLEQLQTSHGFPERIHATGIETKPNNPTNFNKPNLYSQSMDNIQVVPVQLQTAPYPYPSVSIAENYQLFSTQPQLHFPTNSQQSTYLAQPFEKIRNDVEVINKKRPTVPTPKDEDNSGFNDSNEDKNIGTGQSEPSSILNDDNYDIPDPSFFDPYDAAFGKYSKFTEKREPPKKEKIIEKPERYNPNPDNEPEKHVYELQSNDGLEHSHENFQYKPKVSGPPRERLQRDYSDNTGYNEDSAHYDSYGRDFDHEFEGSYQRKIPTEEFAHIKGVPDVDESVLKERIISHREKKRSSRHTITLPLNKNFGSRISRRNDTITESPEQSSELLSNNNRRSLKKNFSRSPKNFSSLNSNNKMSIKTPINENESLKHQ